MAHYFKFHSLEDIDAECRRQGLSISFTEDLSSLFRRVQVGSFQVGNSLCIQPMEGNDGTLDGRPDELTFRRYQRFGAGGAKLIWAEATAVVEEGRASPRQLLIDEQTAPALGDMLRQCRQAHRESWGRDDDLLIGLQLTHSGRYSHRRPFLAVHDPVLDPLTIADKATGKMIDANYPLLDDDYLRKLVDYYARAARLAYQIGFQFVDVKQCHRYLLSELLAARTRPGPYGGSLENRTRLARDIISAIRAEVPDLMVASRLNVFDGHPHRKGAAGMGEPCPVVGEPSGVSLRMVSGESDTPYPAPYGARLANHCSFGACADDPLRPDMAEPIAWVGEMARLGVALVNVSMGSPYANPHVTRPFEYPPPDGYETPEHPLLGVDRHFRLTEELQRKYPELPVVGSGYSYLQEYLYNAAAANLQIGRATFAGVGRAVLAQPDFVRQLQEHGKLDRKRICRTFSYCTALMRSKHNELGQFATGCPPFDKEVYGPIWNEAKKK